MVASLRAILLFVVAAAHPLVPAIDGARVELELGTAAAFAKVRPGFVGTTLSFLYDDPLWFNSSIITIDLDEPQFNTLVRALAPGLLRVGGGGEWPIVMDVHGTECAAANKTGTPLCLTMERWDAILRFAKRTGVQMVWGLGAQDRANGTAPLNFTNINAFLAYTASRGDSVLYQEGGEGGGLLGFELGNELDGGDYTTGAAVEPHTFAADYRTLREVINHHWPVPSDALGASRPLLVGPAMHLQATWARKFLGALGRGVLDMFRYGCSVHCSLFTCSLFTCSLVHCSLFTVNYLFLFLFL